MEIKCTKSKSRLNAKCPCQRKIQKWKYVTAKLMQSVSNKQCPRQIQIQIKTNTEMEIFYIQINANCAEQTMSEANTTEKYNNGNVLQPNQCKVCRTNDVPGKYKYKYRKI